MLLRSSSTPILGSLSFSHSDTPNRDSDNNNNKHFLSSASTTDHYNLKKISFGVGGHQNLISCNSSPFIDQDSNAGNTIRRAQSDGNLQGLVSEDYHHSSKRRHSISMLETIPSFAIYNANNEDEEEEEDDEEQEGFLERTITIGDNIMSIGGGGSQEFSFDKNLMMMDLIEEKQLNGEEDGEDQGEQRPASPPMFLARGLGIDFSGGDGGNGGVFNRKEFGNGKGGDESNMEEYYRKMVQDNPSSSLFLRNYAHFLYETKGDLVGAEEYYSRAILTDPADGEILSKYAKLVWELHHDYERASSYFERAVEVAPEDSHVHAAYASFLWETEDEDEEEDHSRQSLIEVPVFDSRVMSSASA